MIATKHSNLTIEQLWAAFELSSDIVSISHLADGRFVAVNAEFERVHGISRDQAIGRSSTELGLWIDPLQRKVLIDGVIRHGMVRGFATQINGCEGVVLDAVLNATTLHVNGEAFVVVTVRNVTEAVQTNQALRESEDRFLPLFDQSPLPMAMSHEGDSFGSTQYNQAWFKAFGFDPFQDQGKTGLALGIWVNPDDRRAIVEKALKGEETADTEVQMRHADGQLCWISLRVRMSVERKNRVFVFSYFDVTERRKNQQDLQDLNALLQARVESRTAQLQASNDELLQALATLRQTQEQLVQSEKLASLGALVAGVAHEINTPVGNGLTIATALEHRIAQIKTKMDTGITRSDFISFLAEAGAAAEVLTRNLARVGTLVISFKQVCVDQTTSQRRTFMMADIVQELLLPLQSTFRNAACVLVTDVRGNWEIDSYPGPLGQVLTNLVHNAFLHGFNAGKEAGTIAINVRSAKPGTVEIQITDSGRGIDPAIVNKIFDPFFTTRLGQGGSGLGLHIVHNIVNGLLGGQIEVSSGGAQGGTTFTVTIPTVAPALTALKSPANERAMQVQRQ